MEKNCVSTKKLQRIDVTKEMKEKCYKKTKGYEDTIEKVEKEDNLYFITFSKDYTAFGQKQRIARRITEVLWYSRLAKEEKDKNKKIEDYIKEFQENEIVFDGKNIPEFIDTKKDLEKKKKGL